MLVTAPAGNQATNRWLFLPIISSTSRNSLDGSMRTETARFRSRFKRTSSTENAALPSLTDLGCSRILVMQVAEHRLCSHFALSFHGARDWRVSAERQLRAILNCELEQRDEKAAIRHPADHPRTP